MTHYQRCTRCVMDTSAANISFDENGVCNYCTEFLQRHSHLFDEAPEARQARFSALLAEIKTRGQGKPYDSVIGVSGGVDSAWVLVHAVRNGLRPLVFHMDNGWNTELAERNVRHLAEALGVEVLTWRLDAAEYKALMQAFFDADVIDVELLYDNAMQRICFELAEKHDIQYILAGTNMATEGIHIPPNWNWFKHDKKNIQRIARKFGHTDPISLPMIGVLDDLRYRHVKGIQWVSYLDYVDYNKQAVLEALVREFGYTPYPYKHYESLFTRFYQGYILPNKFGVDKRTLHWSTLIATGQVSRETAMRDLQQIAYPSSNDLENDREAFLGRMGWSPQELDDYIARAPVSHAAYGSEKWVWDVLMGLYEKCPVKLSTLKRWLRRG